MNDAVTALERRRTRNRVRIANKRANSPAYREKCRVYSLEYGREHREERRAYSKKLRLRRDYGMTIEMFTQMLVDQGGKCGICGVLMDPPARATKNSVAVTVDHCHDTGIVRGLLCYSCNLALGIFKDSLARVKAAVVYLEKTQSDQIAP